MDGTFHTFTPEDRESVVFAHRGPQQETMDILREHTGQLLELGYRRQQVKMHYEGDYLIVFATFTADVAENDLFAARIKAETQAQIRKQLPGQVATFAEAFVDALLDPGTEHVDLKVTKTGTSDVSEDHGTALCACKETGCREDCGDDLDTETITHADVLEMIEKLQDRLNQCRISLGG